MVAVSAKVNTRRLRRAMDRAPRELAKGFANAFDRHAFIFEGHVKTKRLQGRPGLIGRTGKLARSIGHTRPDRRLKLQNLSVRIFIGNALTPYARIQEFGGVVRPVNKRFLTVPLPANLTAGGVPRFPSAAELLSSRPGQTFIARSRAGNPIIGLREGSSVTWLWVLKKSVRIPARLGFIKAFDSREMRADRRQRLNKAIRDALKGGKRR